MTTKNLVLIPVLSVIVFILEQALLFLPNISLTVFLIILYSKCCGFKKTAWIIFIYVLLDNAFMGTFNIIYMPFIYLGWIIIPLTLNTIFKHVNNTMILAFLSLIYSLTYCYAYIIPSMIVLHINPIAYILSDIVFEIILMISSFVSVLWLYEPCYRILNKFVTY